MVSTMLRPLSPGQHQAVLGSVVRGPRRGSSPLPPGSVSLAVLGVLLAAVGSVGSGVSAAAGKDLY